MNSHHSNHMYDPLASFYHLPAGNGPQPVPMNYYPSHAASLAGEHRSGSGHCVELGAEGQQLTLRSMFHSMTARQSAMLEQFFKTQHGGSRPPRGPILKSLSQNIGLSQAKIKLWYQWRQEQDERRGSMHEHERHELHPMAKESALVSRTSHRHDESLMTAMTTTTATAMAMAMDSMEGAPLSRDTLGQREGHNFRFQSLVKEIQSTLNEAMLIQADWFPNTTDASLLADDGNVSDTDPASHGYGLPS